MILSVETRRVLLASQNRGKLEEMRSLLAQLPFRVLLPREVGIVEAPPETGATFMENAVLKAKYYARRSDQLSIADDSGLSVDAMNGQPGLFSSRFAGEGASDADRNRLLLERLSEVPDAKRTARFTSAVAVALRGDVIFLAQESVDGRIAQAPRGTNGFGYDPLFYYPPLDKTFAEISPEAKALVSHRGKAFARLRSFLATLAS
jgi:XTP/dITP diphosphohydrolase